MKSKSTILVSVLAGLLVACQSDRRLEFDMADAIDAQASAQHAIENAQLRQLMWKLMLAPVDRLPQELDTDREQKWRRDDAVRILGDMARSADRIPDILTGVDLPESQKQKFRGLAATLKTETLQLRRDVPNLSPDQIGQRFDALQNHCVACHEKFRVLPRIE